MIMLGLVLAQTVVFFIASCLAGCAGDREKKARRRHTRQDLQRGVQERPERASLDSTGRIPRDGNRPVDHEQHHRITAAVLPHQSAALMETAQAAAILDCGGRAKRRHRFSNPRDGAQAPSPFALPAQSKNLFH